ncbi:MAG: substrate-binding domain-containing protein [Planctomycetes bacterium]|nr:substrate-binding domain-containing protein [Planctomycetota bacterium]
MKLRALALVWFLSACAPESPVAPVGAEASATAPAAPHTVVVWATASMQPAMERLARRYEQDVPGGRVELFCAGGAELLAKRNAGGACDVLVVGDSSLMSRFAAAAYLAAHSPAELARNRLAIAVGTGSPHAVEGLRDLARPGLRLALGRRSASIGRYSRWALSRLGLEVEPAVEADTAEAVLAAVRDGRADAGIVYVTTFAAAGDPVLRIDVPETDNQPVLYSISLDREAREPKGGAAFRALALGPAGQAILREAGFLPPGSK